VSSDLLVIDGVYRSWPNITEPLRKHQSIHWTLRKSLLMCMFIHLIIKYIICILSARINVHVVSSHPVII